MVTIGSVTEQVEAISRAIEGDAAQRADTGTLAALGERFEALREAYRRGPPAFGPHVERLAALRKRFDAIVAERIGLIADRYHQVCAQLQQLEAEKERWRSALISAAARTPGNRVTGERACVDVRRTVGLNLPPTSDPRRAELDEFVRRAGLWEAASQLSAARLQRALAERPVPEPQREMIRRLCPEVERYQVKCRLRGTATPARPSGAG